MSLTSGQEKTEVFTPANDDRMLSLAALSQGTMANDDLTFRGVVISISLLMNADDTFLKAPVSGTLGKSNGHSSNLGSFNEKIVIAVRKLFIIPWQSFCDAF